MAYVRLTTCVVRFSDILLTRIPLASVSYFKSNNYSSNLFGKSKRPYKFPRCVSSTPLLVSCSSDNIPDVPKPPLVEEIASNLNAIGEPTFASLGLNSYWPSGWYQALLETLHVNCSLPWWAAIATTTVVIRMCLLPLIIDQRRKLAAYTNVMPQITSLQERMTKARISSNYIEMTRVSKEMQDLMKNHDVNPLNSLRLMFVQVPLFLSVFTGIRGMAQLPVESLKTGGIGWFTDLTICDPYYILPFYSMASIFLMFEFGTDVSAKKLTPGVRMAMRFFPVAGFFMIMHMPSALLWYWSISNSISIAQALVLRSKPVREYLQFPEDDKPPPEVVKKRGFVDGFKESMRNSRLLAEMEARERTDAERWQKAGVGAMPKTFAHDITKRPNKPVIAVKGTAAPSPKD